MASPEWIWNLQPAIFKLVFKSIQEHSAIYGFVKEELVKKSYARARKGEQLQPTTVLVKIRIAELAKSKITIEVPFKLRKAETPYLGNGE